MDLSPGVGLEGGTEQRTITTIVHRGTPDDAIDAFYTAALSDVEPCAAWLHDVAMVDYDYLSDDGQGWFRDIDALEKAIAVADRGKVVLCLHGWFDHIGRYCFDPQTGRLDLAWTAFSNYPNVKDFAYEFALVDGEKIRTGFTENRPVKLTIDDMHKRIAYARQRGFRVGLYYASGIESCDALPHYSPERALDWRQVWIGPDTVGKTFVENPRVPAVRAFYLG